MLEPPVQHRKRHGIERAHRVGPCGPVAALVSPSPREHVRRPQNVVQRLEVEHAVAKCIGCAVAFEHPIEVARGPGERPDDRAREYDEAKTERRQLRSREDRRLPALDHVREQRRTGAQGFCDRAELLARPRRLDEENVSPRVRVTFGALDRGLESLDSDGVGARDDERLRLPPRVGRRMDLANHLMHRHDALALEMPAPLGKRLVLELDRSRSRPLEQPHCPLHVESVAVTGVGVDNNRRLDAFANLGERVGDFARRHKADVGAAEPGVGDCRAGEIERLEPGGSSERGSQRIVDAGRHHDAVLSDPRFERQGLPQSVGRVGHGYFPE